MRMGPPGLPVDGPPCCDFPVRTCSGETAGDGFPGGSGDTGGGGPAGVARGAGQAPGGTPGGRGREDYGNGPVEQGGGLPGSPWPRSCAGTGISPPARASRSRPGKSAAWSSADLLADPRSAGSARVRPPARDQPTVPRQQRARRDQPAGALHGRQRPGQCRQDGAVGPVRLGRGS
jgi:hypothetical protein